MFIMSYARAFRQAAGLRQSAASFMKSGNAPLAYTPRAASVFSACSMRPAAAAAQAFGASRSAPAFSACPPMMGFAASGMGPDAGGASGSGVSAGSGGGDASLSSGEATNSVSGSDSMESTENKRGRRKRYKHMPAACGI